MFRPRKVTISSCAYRKCKTEKYIYVALLTVYICMLHIENILQYRKYRKMINNYVKCKAIPLQAWTGPEGSRRVRVPDFKTIGT